MRNSMFLVAVLGSAAALGCGDVTVADGVNTLVAVTAEDAGDNCPAGGFKISTGADINSNGILDDDEVEATNFACNGAEGAEGDVGDNGIPGPASLVDLNPEPPGDNCRFGGTRIESGIDANADGVLNPQEVSETAFACNGGGLPLPSLVNGNFETGDFSDWVTQDLASPFNPLVVSSQAAKDGGFGVLTGFDGGGTPGDDRIFVAQDVDLSGVGLAAVSFDWEVPSCSPTGGMLDRVFSLEIEPAGGGMALFSQTIFTCLAGSNSSNPLVNDQVIDISAVSNQPVRIKFQWLVPENFTGPAEAHLDDVKLVDP